MFKYTYSLFVSTCLIFITACGGGGGGSSEPPPPNNTATFSLSEQSITFNGMEGRYPPPTQSVIGTVTGATDNIYIIVEVPNNGVVADVSVSITGNTGTLTIYPGDPDFLREGTHQASITVKVCNNSTCSSQISGSPKYIQVTYNVDYDPNIADRDGDGVVDAEDLFPEDPNESTDADLDGIGDNGDPDDDNDGVVDTEDLFPLDPNEWADNDLDGIGDNADPNDDNDYFADADDLFPNDATRPAKLYTVTPGTIIQGQTTKVILSGVQLSLIETLTLDGSPINFTILSDTAVELEVTPNSVGLSNLVIDYPDSTYQTTATFNTVAPVYYPYSVVTRDSYTTKAYWHPQTQSVYSIDGSNGVANIVKHQYQSGGAWVASELTMNNLRGLALSHDDNTLVAITEGSLVEINLQNFTIGTERVLDTGGDYLTDGEFNHLNQAILVSNMNGSGATAIFNFDLEVDSPSFNTQKTINDLYRSAIGASHDGRMIVLGENGLSPDQPLVHFNTLNETQTEMPPTHDYAESSISRNGDLVLINDHYLYNASFEALGTISNIPNITSTDLALSGDFAIAASAENQLLYFNTTSLDGSELSALHTSALPIEMGTIHHVKISRDELTVFVFGESKTLIVPIWQITEGAIGSAQVCPTAGCGNITVADGVRQPGDAIIPPDRIDEPSPAAHISPTYVLNGSSLEALLTGSGFSPSSVVTFDNTVATEVRYVSDTELWVGVPNLALGYSTVYVDGKTHGAPMFNVKAPQSVTENYWPNGGYFTNLIYHPNNLLYAHEYLTRTIYRIDLSDNSITSQVLTGMTDLAWCAENDSLFATVGAEVVQIDMATLAQVAVVANVGTVLTPEFNQLECVAENKLVLTYSNTSAYYQLLDIDTQTVENSSDFIGNHPARFYKATLDGVSARGDWIYFGESGTSGPDNVIFSPYKLTQERFNDTTEFYTSSWSFDGEVGILNTTSVVDNTMTELASLTSLGTIQQSVMSPQADRIYVFIGASVHLVNFDPQNPVIASSSERLITDDIGIPRKMATSLDGKTVFIAGENGIVSVNFN